MTRLWPEAAGADEDRVPIAQSSGRSQPFAGDAGFAREPCQEGGVVLPGAVGIGGRHQLRRWQIGALGQ